MSRRREPVGPEALLRLYRALGAEGRAAFRDLLAGEITAAEQDQMWAALPWSERRRFAWTVGERCVDVLLSLLMRAAARIARASPGLTDDDLVRRLDGWFRSTFADAADARVAEAEADCKRRRDPKSSLRTIRRNVAIIDRRQEAPERTAGQLAKEFGVSRQYVAGVLKAAVEWRRKLRDATE